VHNSLAAASAILESRRSRMANFRFGMFAGSHHRIIDFGPEPSISFAVIVNMPQ